MKFHFHLILIKIRGFGVLGSNTKLNEDVTHKTLRIAMIFLIKTQPRVISEIAHT